MDTLKRRSTADAGDMNQEPDTKKKSAAELHFDDGDVMSDFSDFETDKSDEVSGNESGKGSSIDSTGEMVEQDDGFYGLPAAMKQLLHKYRKIDKLYEWQERLMVRLLEDKKNVIYCVPTSGGKTLVAELLLMRQLLCDGRDAVLVLPFVSIVQEKLRSLRPFAEAFNFVIEEYAGSRGTVPVKKRRSMRTLYVATIEKANVVVSSLFEMDRFREIGLFVVDELHMIGDGTPRGVTLETLIVKTKLMALKSGTEIRFLGMSATLSNFGDLGRFLNAQIIEDNFRPVVLKEYVKFGDFMYDASDISKGYRFEDMPLIRKIESESSVREDPENIRLLVGEVVPQKSSLVFCPTKKHCECLALTLSRVVSNRSSLLVHKKQEKNLLIRAIRMANNGSICKILSQTLPCGIAYHHSGLTPEERVLVEEAFSRQIISCIICTSTLAAGVNLPAERVIIRDPYVGRQFLSKAQYQQMCGRAGRAGLCDQGESILIASAKDRQNIQDLFETPMPSCKSGLIVIENELSAFILTLLRYQLTVNKKDIIHILATETLAGVQISETILSSHVEKSLVQLQSLSLIQFDEKTDSFQVTSVGNGVVRSLIDVTKSQGIYEELYKSQCSMDLTNYLQLIYMTTLLMNDNDLPAYPDAEAFLNSYSQLTEEQQKSAANFGLTIGLVSSYFSPHAKATLKLRRLYATLVIFEVWHHRTDLCQLANKHKMQRGTLFTLLGNAASCANSLFRFVEENKKELWSYHRLLPDVCEALTHCCAPELMPLMQLPEMRIPRARQLYSAGFKDIRSIAQVKNCSEITRKIELLNQAQARKIIQRARHIMRCQKDEFEQQVEECKVPALGEATDLFNNSTADESDIFGNYDL